MTLASLSVVIPAYNEEGALERVVRGLLELSPSCAREFEIIIVDDGSVDATPRIADRLAVGSVRVFHHGENRGFGAAFRTGIEAARGEYVILVPADDQFPPEDLRRFLAPPEADLVIGYRVRRPDPPMRRLATTVLRMLMLIGFGVTFRDIQWVKLYRRALLSRLDLSSCGIGIDAEIVVKATAVGARIREIPVGYRERRTGTATGGRPGRVIRTLLEIARLWWWRYAG
jgi:glycosyltransferase involved in cell wall biosynthesis